ncbi:type IV pilus modification PilV family protein [Lacunimicrobium album]
MKPVLSTPEQRTGATLIEVLMALMIMSIGVVSVATLFPLALKRAVQATQLTNSQILREQVIEMLKVHPELIPINDRFVHDYSVPKVAGVTPRALFPYGPNVPLTLWRDIEVVRIVDPLGMYEYGDSATAGTVGVMDSNDDFSYPKFASVPADKINPRPAFAPGFANPSIPVRIGGSWNREQAFSRVPLRDSWVTDQETTFIPTAQPNLSVIEHPPQLENLFDDLGSRLATSELRVLVLDSDAKTAQLRGITSIDDATNRITLDRPLPNNGRYNAVSQVRIQEFEQRYTWMLTTRTTLIGTEEVRTHIDLAIFFRRDFSPASETPHKLLYLDAQAIKPGRIRQDQRKFPYIILDPTTPATTLGSGDWIFDYRRANWFQIRQILSEGIVTNALVTQSANDGIKAADQDKRIYQVELSDFDQSHEEGLDTNADGEDINSLKITLPRGVMQVYDLGNTTQKLDVQ